MPTEKRKVTTTTHDGTTGSLSDEEVRTIIEMYQAETPGGEALYTLAEITQATRRPRGTIYWVLREAGIVPKRIRRTPRGAPSVDELLTEVADLKRELEREKSVNSRLMKLLAAIETADTGTKTSERKPKAK